MSALTSSLPLAVEGDRRATAARWLAGTLETWSLPGQLHRGWLPAVERGLATPGPVEVGLEYDQDLGLVSVEVRDASGKVLVGLDDFVGGP